MRGVRITHETLADGALWADAVYLSHYAADGELRLIKLGEIAPDDAAPPVARIADKLELVSAGLQPGERDSEVRLQLVWRPLARGVGRHLLCAHDGRRGALGAGADGDALGGMFPLVVWPSGRLLTDWRILDPGRPSAGEYRVTVGPITAKAWNATGPSASQTSVSRRTRSWWAPCRSPEARSAHGRAYSSSGACSG